MSDTAHPSYRGGRNLAMKIPPHQFDATVAFYRDVLKLESLGRVGASETFAFGSMRLWLDPVPTVSQAELWLEILSDDVEGTAAHLAAAGVPRCDAIEPLPDGFQGFCTLNPAGIVHLVTRPSDAGSRKA